MLYIDGQRITKGALCGESLLHAWPCSTLRGSFGCICRLYEASRQLRVYLRRDAGKAMRLWVSLALLTGYAAHHFTLAHPFLLADNRCVVLTASLTQGVPE